jgi:hypothetical protein
MAGYFTDTVNHVFSADQAITADAISTNVIDLQSTPTLRDLSISGAVVEFIVTETFLTTVSIDFTVESDSTANLATSATVHALKNITLASGGLAAGQRFVLPIAPGQNVERYLGVRYNVNTDATAGKIKAYLVPSAAPSMQYFPDGSSIS